MGEPPAPNNTPRWPCIRCGRRSDSLDLCPDCRAREDSSTPAKRPGAALIAVAALLAMLTLAGVFLWLARG